MFFEEHAKLLSEFARVSQAAGARADYVQGGGGNTSVKLPGGLMAIKASGFCLSDIRPDKAYAVLDEPICAISISRPSRPRLRTWKKRAPPVPRPISGILTALPTCGRPSKRAFTPS
ncbi:MAG: class II aldolase/adducin family protein [Oscillospiraceae bacterium]